MKPHKATDTRAIRDGEHRRLLGLTIFLLLVVGTALIGLFYGWQAAAIGGACMLGGVGLLLFVWLCVVVIGKIAGEDR